MTERVLVIGAGSIGSRHARNLATLGLDVSITDPDPRRTVARARSVPFDLDRIDGYDGIVVASPTSRHGEHIRRALATSAAVMVEKPVALLDDAIDDLIDTAAGRTLVAYNLRLHEPVERLVACVVGGEVGTMTHARLWFGSWLPDWRPTVDYRTTYSARADLGGGVLLDAIHELDEAVWLFGTELEVVGSVVTMRGPLDIDVEDTVHAQLCTPDGLAVHVSLDYISRRYRRGIEVVGDRGTVRYDWATRELTIDTAESSQREVIDTPVDRSYEREAERFVALIRHGTAPPVDLPTGLASLGLARAIRDHARRPVDIGTGVPR